jgi:hypothetical protein
MVEVLAIAQCFLRLFNLDPTLLDRVGSYEARLWRQAAEIMWTAAIGSGAAPVSQAHGAVLLGC